MFFRKQGREYSSLQILIPIFAFRIQGYDCFLAAGKQVFGFRFISLALIIIGSNPIKVPNVV